MIKGIKGGRLKTIGSLDEVNELNSKNKFSDGRLKKHR